MDLEGKIAIVTGAGSGIGRATALLFAQHGAKVIAADITGKQDETAAENPAAITAVKADAGSEADVQMLVAKALELHGSLQVFYANAGISGGMEGIFDQSVEEWERILRINLIGPFLAIKHGGKAMADGGKGGSIICTASVAGLRSGAGGPAYTASKAGVINLVRIGAQQLTGSSVRCNAICPGLIETGMTEFIYNKARERGFEDKIGQLNPLQRGGIPNEIAEAALFLASDRSSYVNGHALVVDGGLSASHPYARQKFGQTAS
ncbi:SDR family NAD(P)-dependent oxidoreductase [Blastomonas sp.]|uniref:SDR family NAD(P)-dependent oxidoreductase n=1 Tax=Blastomonas sp. TaxID=1909299 RepID=UPI00359458CD